MLSLDRFTPDARALVIAAQNLADERKHGQVVPLHLLVAALTGGRGISDVFRRAGVDSAELSSAAGRSLAALPRSNEPAYLSGAMLDFLERSEREAERAAQKLVRPEDLLNALTQELRGPVGELFSSFNLVPGALRQHVSALGSVAQASAATPLAVGVTPGDPLRSLALPEQLAKEPQIVGRTAELARLLTVLERRTKSHPLLVGEPGVGKRAIVSALARRLAGKAVPSGLAGAELFVLDVSLLVAGARLRGEVEERTRQLIARLSGAAEPNILAVFGLEQLFGAGTGGAVSDLLRSALEREAFRLLGTTTPDGLRKIQDRDPYFLRSMTVLEIAEPSEADAIEILGAVAIRLGEHHRVAVAPGAVRAAVQLGKRYVQDRFLPDSAIDLLDEAAARKRVELDEPARERGEARAAPADALAAEDVAATLAIWTGIPVQRMLEGEAEKLLNMEQRLAQRVVGQDHAVAAIARAVRRGRVGLRDPGRPIGSFLFLGPSGVGKTELAKALAQLLFDDEHALTRLDMSEFMERHMAQRLIGAPPGYADSDQGGFLTEAVRRRPYSVLLFDEVEKAHQDVFNLLLQVLDEGRLTDGRGRSADFSNTVVIMTSNIGSDRILQTEPKLFESDEGREALRDVLLDRLREFFRPELLNRIDELLVFRPLARDHLRRVLEIQLASVERLLAPRGLRLEVSDAARARLVELGYEPALGARPLKRTIVRHVQDPLAEALLAGRFPEGSAIVVDVSGDDIVLAP
ncbi:MAG TPA: ATP-dependent Clp protease ATP-binding subunit [Polyangiaceae bacterium]